MLIIGSHAMLQYSDNFREPRDLDVMGAYSEVIEYINSLEGEVYFCYPKSEGNKIVAKVGSQCIEAEIAWEGSLAEEFIKIMDKQGYNKYANIDGLFTLKMSHRYLRNSPFFKKTMDDIHLLKSMGAKIPDYLKDWYERREKETYNYKHPALNTDKGTFFETEGVEYTYDHDDIHKAVKVGPTPAYTLFLKDGAEVDCCAVKFNSLPHDKKLHAVLEESYTLAIERSLVPNNFEPSPEWAFNMALMKVCTSITSGWFREFSWEHYEEVKSLYNPNYVDKFLCELNKGKVRTYVL